MNYGMKGRFTIHKQKVKMQDGKPMLDSKGDQILIGDPERVADFDNLITDGGLNKLGTTNDVLQYFYLSTDNTIPKFEDSTVPQLIGGVKDTLKMGISDSSLVTAPHYMTRFMTKRFPAGIGTGNITKVATGWGTATRVDGLWSTALLKNSDGSPITITKLADEILDVTYNLTTYVSDTDYTGVVTISGEPYNVIVRPSSMSADWFGNEYPISSLGFNNLRGSTWDIGDATGFPNGMGGHDPAMTTNPYVDKSCELTGVGVFDLTQANYAIRAVEIHFMQVSSPRYIRRNYWQIRFGKVSDDSPIMKTKDHTLTLPPFTISWGRYEGDL